MSGNLRKEDLRVVKTYIALTNALIELLNQRNFGKITVNDLCEEALISRAAFYAHFNDKYDLLNYWLGNLFEQIRNTINDETYEPLEELINTFFEMHAKVIRNLLEDANKEIVDIVHLFLYSVIDCCMEELGCERTHHNQTILINFCVGGTMRLITMQAKGRPSDDSMQISNYFYEMMTYLINWDKNQS